MEVLPENRVRIVQRGFQLDLLSFFIQAVYTVLGLLFLAEYRNTVNFKTLLANIIQSFSNGRIQVSEVFF